MKGPLGLWPFPLVTLLTNLVQSMGSNRGSGRPALVVPRENLVTNSEDISWTDWKGRERNMTIRREIK